MEAASSADDAADEKKLRKERLSERAKKIAGLMRLFQTRAAELDLGRMVAELAELRPLKLGGP